MSSKPKVLVIEDVEANRRVLEISLRQEYDVQLSSDGLHGLTAAVDDLPDLIVLDVGLPLMNGWEVFEALTTRPETAHIPIIIVTAHGDTAEQWGEILRDVDQFITKPFLPEDLRQKARAAI